MRSIQCQGSTRSQMTMVPYDTFWQSMTTLFRTHATIDVAEWQHNEHSFVTRFLGKLQLQPGGYPAPHLNAPQILASFMEHIAERL